MTRFALVAVLPAWLGAAAAAADPDAGLPPRLYDLTIETGMPHLDENLRYASTHGKNMTFHQRIAGRVIGPCGATEGAPDVAQGKP